MYQNHVTAGHLQQLYSHMLVYYHIPPSSSLTAELQQPVFSLFFKILFENNQSNSHIYTQDFFNQSYFVEQLQAWFGILRTENWGTIAAYTLDALPNH